MNATQDIAMKSASCPSSLSADLATTQRTKNLHSFQAKYDTMLYIVELMASFQLLNIKNPKQVKKIEDVKSLVTQTRNGLGICQTIKH